MGVGAGKQFSNFVGAMYSTPSTHDNLLWHNGCLEAPVHAHHANAVEVSQV